MKVLYYQLIVKDKIFIVRHELKEIGGKVLLQRIQAVSDVHISDKIAIKPEV